MNETQQDILNDFIEQPKPATIGKRVGAAIIDGIILIIVFVVLEEGRGGQTMPGGKFIRIHKSYILAVASITAVRKNSVFINDLELPVGETYREAIWLLTKRDL